MSVITLTTDWGQKDYYRAAVVGKLLSQTPKLPIIDISHNVANHNFMEAAFILQNAYKSFPKGSIHIIGVDAIPSDKKPHTLVQANGHYFIAADNGIFSLLFNEKDDIEKVILIDVIQDSDYYTFPERDVFAKVALHIHAKKDIEELGDLIPKFREALPHKPTIGHNFVSGVVLYIDSYNNAITNLSLHKLQDKLNKKFTISFEKYTITEIHDSYDDVPEGEMIALFGSNGLLQIALNKDRADKLLGLKERSVIRIDFEN
jgi:S-adenosylmethionine hydrolase